MVKEHWENSPNPEQPCSQQRAMAASNRGAACLDGQTTAGLLSFPMICVSPKRSSNPMKGESPICLYSSHCGLQMEWHWILEKKATFLVHVVWVGNCAFCAFCRIWVSKMVSFPGYQTSAQGLFGGGKGLALGLLRTSPGLCLFS